MTVKANPMLDNKYNKLKLPSILALTESDNTKKHGIGYSTKEGWDALMGTLIKLELIKKPLETSSVFTTEFLK